jgi:hypothetical protein
MTKKEPQASSGELAVLFYILLNVQLTKLSLLNVDRLAYLKPLLDTFCYAIL